MEINQNYLVDTNVWLERLLGQKQSQVVYQFLELFPVSNLYVSDFSVHSIGVILLRYNKLDVLRRFIDDLFGDAEIELLSLRGREILDVIQNVRKFKLDFDDAYQLAIAQKYDLTIVTFDKDFDTFGIKKVSPVDILKKF